MPPKKKKDAEFVDTSAEGATAASTPAFASQWHGQFSIGNADLENRLSDNALTQEFGHPLHPVWTTGQPGLPIIKSFTAIWSPLPEEKKPTKSKKPTANQRNPPKEPSVSGKGDIKMRLMAAWRADLLKINGARLLNTWNRSNLNAGFVMSYLAFPNASSLLSWTMHQGSYPSPPPPKNQSWTWNAASCCRS